VLFFVLLLVCADLIEIVVPDAWQPWGMTWGDRTYGSNEFDGVWAIRGGAQLQHHVADHEALVEATRALGAPPECLAAVIAEEIHCDFRHSSGAEVRATTTGRPHLVMTLTDETRAMAMGTYTIRVMNRTLEHRAHEKRPGERR
jgi:hypothetical protein